MAYTLAGVARSELEIKKSRFLGLVLPATDRAEAQAVVSRLRAEHPQAAHVCWALLAGGHSAANDDGEPGGTAGRPMLEVLRHQELEQVLAVVVRYYGGVKLGAGGLVRAYTDAVAQALIGAEKVAITPRQALTVRVPYPQEGLVRRLLQEVGAELGAVTHADAVTLNFTVRLSDSPPLMQRIADACHGAAQWLDAAD
ncbi:IMPACT family protein [Chitinolyticbacter albus]|uniref:IMPACT family protein n=1 Tax=Chitinolyticbacter albus TaxID=2961951 RepID=UPI002109FE40|nr:YigZ family protein [Chitinolyticbacter albus]